MSYINNTSNSQVYARVINSSEYKLIRTKSDYPDKEYKGKVIFFYGNKFLVGEELNNMKRSPYTLLGGTCEPNETIIDCTAREVNEETIGLISEEELKSVLNKLKKHNIVTWRYKIKNKVITQYLFFVPWTSLSRTHRKSVISIKFKERKIILDKIFDKQKVPAGKLSNDIKSKINKQLDMEIPIEKISKSFLKHFYEFQNIEWITMNQLLDTNVTNENIVKKINNIYISNSKKTFQEYFERIKSKRKKTVISIDSNGWNTKKKIS